MYAETYHDWIAGLFERSFLLHGFPCVWEIGGAGRLGYEFGQRREYYLYERVMLAEPNVAGTKYYAGKSDYSRLRPGGRVALVRERTNKFDRCAVEVYAPGGGKLGYVPRYAAPLVAGALDRGRRVYARVRRADPDSNSISIRIYLCRPSFLSAG